jgi:hypothetical protein
VVAQRLEKLTSARFVFDVLRTKTAEIKKHEDQPPNNTPIQTCTPPKEQTNLDNLFHRNHKRQRSEEDKTKLVQPAGELFATTNPMGNCSEKVRLFSSKQKCHSWFLQRWCDVPDVL